ncbi:MAG: DNA adenine methylase, partial [Nanoarchaeota archaeon]
MIINYIPYPGNKKRWINLFRELLSDYNLKEYDLIEPFGGSGVFSLSFSSMFNRIYLNDNYIHLYKIHSSFKNGTYKELESIINEIWSYGDPKNNKKDYYKARNTLNKKYYSENINIKEGFYNWAISTFAIHSMMRFGPNGFNQGWGKRGLNRSQPTQLMNPDKFKIINDSYKNIFLSNDDWTATLNNKINKNVYFLDPPYFDMKNGIYDISKGDYLRYIEKVKSIKGLILYTDIFSEERLELLGREWNYKILRENIGHGK